MLDLMGVPPEWRLEIVQQARFIHDTLRVKGSEGRFFNLEPEDYFDPE